MPDIRYRPPEELRALLEELDRVMDEAAHLREQVTEQLNAHRARQRSRVTPPRERPYGER